MFALQSFEPLGLLPSTNSWLSSLAQLDEKAGMPTAHCVQLASAVEPLQGVVPHRFEEPRAGLARRCGFRRLHLDQALIDWRPNHLEDVNAQLISVGHQLGGVQRPAANEDAKSAEDGLLDRGEQVEAPVQVVCNVGCRIGAVRLFRSGSRRVAASDDLSTLPL
jgi:hypothetical protein